MRAALELTRGGFTLSAKAEWPDKGMTVIAGPSGAGKTSFLRAILGLERAAGQVEFAGKLLQDAEHFVPVHQRRMAWVSQHDDVFSHLSVAQNLAFAARFAAPGGPALADMAERFGLTPYLAQNAGALSGGQKQRLILARALMSNPRLLALDEPFGALDAEARHGLLDLLQAYCAAQDLPILFVSHDFDTLTRLADFMLYMEEGRVIAQAPLNPCLLDKSLPYRYREEACVVMDALVQGYDAEHGLNQLSIGRVPMVVPGAALPVGGTVRLRLRGGDISLSRTRHEDSSVLNILSALVITVEHANGQSALAPGSVNVTLALNGDPVLVRITEKSARALGLDAGDTVYAQIKASALVSG
ncbi:MAG: ATP-binding cassette domain-containing protein [Robiginitomaculum sp.]|nr:ATP-binding cassette domain-containing protein [Robiginitomaculum sp.]MDQ7077433.1 ATP-binding cassette domain-containing protein [Robiginitomaculum sp.]